MELIDLLVSGGQEACLIHFRINSTAGEGLRINILQSANLHISEPEEGKVGADDTGNTIGNVCKLRFCGAVIFVIEAAVLQDLTEFQLQLRSLGN